MAITYEDVSDSFRRIVLSGRLDSKGTDEIAVKFAALSTAAKRRVLVDLTGISFLASIGIRAVLSNAKALQNNGGRMVLFVGGNSAVAKTLEATGIDTLVPMFANAAEAEKAALG
ncbi:MAG TPA: STAS domain-containing protein [Burkholderiales bacterium]|nr:STAS domain-containing protein [Burkholderiales bacterium]